MTTLVVGCDRLSNSLHVEECMKEVPFIDSISKVVTLGSKYTDMFALLWFQERGVEISVKQPNYYKYRTKAERVLLGTLIPRVDSVICITNSFSEREEFVIGRCEQRLKDDDHFKFFLWDTQINGTKFYF